MAISDVEIAKAAKAAGFPDNFLATAVAVALAESSGNPTATHRNTNGTTDYGLWQINSIHKTDLANGKWSDPTDNARMAYAVFRRAGNSWWPWSAFKSGRHAQYMSRGNEAVRAINANPLNVSNTFYSGDSSTVTSNTALGVSGALKGVEIALNLLTQKNFWIRLGLIWGGILLAIAGMIWLGKSFVVGTGAGTVANVVKGLSE